MIEDTVGGVNVVLVCFAALAAFLGLIVIAARGSRFNVLRAAPLLSAFCVAAVAAFVLEATVFNWGSYMKPFGGPEVRTSDVSAENPGAVLTTNGTPAVIVEEAGDAKAGLAGVFFTDLNMKVTSVYVELDFGNTEAREVHLAWMDERYYANGFKKTLNKRVPRDNCIPLRPYGKVKSLKVMFPVAAEGEDEIVIESIALNKAIPFYFSGLRLFAVSFLLFAALCFLKKDARARASRLLFECKFNPADKKQNLIYGGAVGFLILFSFVCVYTSYNERYMDNPVHQQYNKFLVDALIQGRTWLDYGTPQNLLNAERPYDNDYRIANGYKFNSDVMWDWAWYKGRFYCYFGAVPAVMLYLPYKLVTGSYLSNFAGVWFFTAASAVLMALLWRFCVKRWMPNAGFVFYVLSYLTLFFASGLFAQIRFPRVYSIVRTSGLMFALAGILLLLSADKGDKLNRVKVFFACLCLALIAGCRPNMIFVSLLVPAVLWKYRSWKLLPYVAIPYAIVAAPLCFYNYVRFESIFEFGVSYMLTAVDVTHDVLLNPIARAVKGILIAAAYLFTPNSFSLWFPYVECYAPPADFGIMPGLVGGVGSVAGMVNFPIVFCLLYLFKSKGWKISGKEDIGINLIVTFIVIGAVIVAVNSFIMGLSVFYTNDFAFFFLLPSLFCGYHWTAAVGGEGRVSPAITNVRSKERAAVVHILLAASISVGLFLCVSGLGSQAPHDPAVYRYLECSLGFFRSV